MVTSTTPLKESIGHLQSLNPEQHGYLEDHTREALQAEVQSPEFQEAVRPEGGTSLRIFIVSGESPKANTIQSCSRTLMQDIFAVKDGDFPWELQEKFSKHKGRVTDVLLVHTEGGRSTPFGGLQIVRSAAVDPNGQNKLWTPSVEAIESEWGEDSEATLQACPVGDGTLLDVYNNGDVYDLAYLGVSEAYRSKFVACEERAAGEGFKALDLLFAAAQIAVGVNKGKVVLGAMDRGLIAVLGRIGPWNRISPNMQDRPIMTRVPRSDGKPSNNSNVIFCDIERWRQEAQQNKPEVHELLWGSVLRDCGVEVVDLGVEQDSKVEPCLA